MELRPTSLFLVALAEDSTNAGCLNLYSHVRGGFCLFTLGPLGSLSVLGHSEWWDSEGQVAPSDFVLPVCLGLLTKQRTPGTLLPGVRAR